LQSAVASARDSAATLTAIALQLLQGERTAFQKYQTFYCVGCDVVSGLGRDVTASSRNMLGQIAQDYPTSAWALCAYGTSLLEEASLGEGDYDRRKLDSAAVVLEAAARATAPPAVRAALERQRATLREIRGGLR
jgi:hypothetical protein